jgi:7-carboxy-7-deazaguanine synthase
VSEQSLSLIEIYESIQGETSLAGCMTSFVRLAGCPLRCRWCDSAFSFERGKSVTLSSITAAIEHYGWRYVCITGGEPLLQPAVIPLLEALVLKKYVVSLETNGALSTARVPNAVRVILDVKCPQSGMSEKNDWSNLSRLRPYDEVKFVIADRLDYEWAKQVIAQHALFAKVEQVLLSPVFGELFPEDLVTWMAEDNLPARLNLQIHKYIWEPTKRGV